MVKLSPEKQIGLPAVVLPMLALLFWAVPWEGDPRMRPVSERLFQLKTSSWPWDQAEYQRMLDSIDVNQLVEGKPLFVNLAIETKDEAMLQRMISRGANVNSSDWGCTPMLAAIEMDSAREKDKSSSVSFLAPLLLRAGADPNLLPTQKSVDQRLATGIPKLVCSTLDELLKERNASLLRILIETAPSDGLIDLLVEKGARPTDQKDAQAILTKVMEGGRFGDAEDALVDLTRKSGASLDAAFSGGRYFGYSTPLARAIGSGRGASEVVRMVKHGADPNRRTAKGELPLQLAIERCSEVRTMFDREREEESHMSDFMARDWRNADKQGQEGNVNTLEIVNSLLAVGADPNLPLKPDGDGGSILAHAVRHCPSDVPRLLLAYKARVDGAAIKAARFDLKSLLQTHAGGAQ